MRIGVAALCAGVLALAGCGASLRVSDPRGYEACVLLDESAAPGRDPAERPIAYAAAGKEASQSSTPEIRATATKVISKDDHPDIQNLEDIWTVAPYRLEEACRNAGFEFSNR